MDRGGGCAATARIRRARLARRTPPNRARMLHQFVDGDAMTMLSNPTPTMAVRIPAGSRWLDGDLGIPADPQGIVLFAHGSSGSRHAPRDQNIARTLQQRGFATLLVDLLTHEEEAADRWTGRLRFDIELLASRLVGIVDWLGRRPGVASLPIGLFGTSTGVAAALVAAAERPGEITAVVSRAGRPDLAEDALSRVRAPALFIVGELDTAVLAVNRDSMTRLRSQAALDIIPRATHRFEERGALDRVATLAADWFDRHLAPARAMTAGGSAAAK